MYKYLIIVEQSEHNFAAYSPDLPGCVATGKTQTEVAKNMRTAIEMHLEGLQEDGLPIPEPRSQADYVSVAVA
ncbi:type II toxin-antitoxin system HicB family antitoxin [bacterium]|nr:type II toxin-antitoxin system HicB family antitoxin [bacterium]